MKQEPKNESGGRGRGRKEHKRRPRVVGFTYASSEVHFRSTESQTFYRSIMTADDSIKCRCANSGMTGQVGGFQNPGVCLQAFPSFLPHPLPALLLTPFFARSLTLVPRSLLLNRTETLAMQACHTWPFRIVRSDRQWCWVPHSVWGGGLGIKPSGGEGTKGWKEWPFPFSPPSPPLPSGEIYYLLFHQVVFDATDYCIFFST